MLAQFRAPFLASDFPENRFSLFGPIAFSQASDCSENRFPLFGPMLYSGPKSRFGAVIWNSGIPGCGMNISMQLPGPSVNIQGWVT